MARNYKKHGSSFKAKVALDAIKEKKTVSDLCQEYGLAASQIFAWKKHVEGNTNKLFEEKGKDDHKGEIDRLHAVIGKITAERDFLDRALNH